MTTTATDVGAFVGGSLFDLILHFGKVDSLYPENSEHSGLLGALSDPQEKAAATKKRGNWK